MMMRNTFIWLTLLILVGMLSCEKIDNNPENPFQQQDPSDTSDAEPDLSGIEGLHQNVFAVRCANPTCHDGSFEPDFRTVQSTYSSLVYHPVTKNDDQNSYTFRVYPGKAEESWMVHRITTDDQVLGRMPLYAEPLSTQEIEAIKSWINNGAKDIFGSNAQFPNLPPVVHGYQAFDANNQRADTMRVDGWPSPMIFNSSALYAITFYVEDDTTQTAGLKNQVLEFSYNRDNFTPVKSIPVSKLWENVTRAQINTSDFNSGQTVYFRYRLEDEDGAGTSMPADHHEFWWKEHYSFVVQ